MARMRMMLVLTLAATAGLLLSYGTYRYLKNIPVKTISAPTLSVVVAAADLEMGAEIRPEDVRAVQWPASAAPKGAFRETSDVVGRGLVMPVIENEPILDMKLAPKDAGAGLPPIIPKGMRAVSVRVNDVIGVAGYVLPGTHVDVVATQSPTDQKADTTTKIVLANVQVLASGTKIEQDRERGKPMPVTVVTMLVTPEEAERLTLASTEGKIQLALRNPLDDGAPLTLGVRPAFLMRGRVPMRLAVAHKKQPVADPVVPAYSVEIIRGDKRVEEVVR